MTASRRERICRLRQDNPCLTLQEIGSRVGLSRERVRQILEAESQPTKAIKRPKRGRAICPNCGVTFVCRNPGQVHCSTKCFSAQHQIPLMCDWCGHLFTRGQSVVLYWARRKPDRKWFCGRRCLGFYIAKHYGFQAHPPEKLTHCKRGHPFDDSNTYWIGQKRVCLTCKRRLGRETYRRKRAREPSLLSSVASP